MDKIYLKIGDLSLWVLSPHTYGGSYYLIQEFRKSDNEVRHKQSNKYLTSDLIKSILIGLNTTAEETFPQLEENCRDLTLSDNWLPIGYGEQSALIRVGQK